MANYLDGMTEEQVAAVLAPTDVPILVNAAAGSGKTHLLTRRAAYLIDELGYVPGALLLTSFSRTAAQEIVDRTKALIGDAASEIWAGTIHSFCLKLLRSEMRRVEVVADSEQSILLRRATEQAQQEAGIGPDDRRYRGARYWSQWIEQIKLAMLPITALDDAVALLRQTAEASRPRHPSNPLVAYIAARAWQEYEGLKGGKYDFTDMLTGAYKLLLDSRVAARWQTVIQYCIVDEYQDTSKIQVDILDIVSKRAHLFCVGDPDQALYSFRGASPADTVYSFLGRYPGSRLYQLTRNYRSTATIITASNSLISHSYNESNRQYQKTMVPHPTASVGEPIRVTGYGGDREEAERVASEIEEEITSGAKLPSDYFILYRVNAQSEPFEDKLAARGIPFVVKGGSFWSRKRVSDCIAYVDLAYDTDNNAAFLSVYDVASEDYHAPTRYLGKQFVEECQNAGERSLYAGMLKAKPKLWRNKQMGVDDFTKYIDALQTMILEEADPSTLLYRVMTTYREYLRRRDGMDSPEDSEDLDQMLMAAYRYDNWDDFKVFVERMRNAASKVDANAVQLMTAHGSKGLERGVVYMVGASDGVLPHWMSTGDTIDLRTGKTDDDGKDEVITVSNVNMAPSAHNGSVEEERCIAYVLMTRPKTELRISWCEQIGKRVGLEPSRYLVEAGLEFSAVLDEPAQEVDEIGRVDDAEAVESTGEPRAALLAGPLVLAEDTPDAGGGVPGSVGNVA
jgi:DNA helicase II / ATP-dependent DNA helicase PcrA